MLLPYVHPARHITS